MKITFQFSGKSGNELLDKYNSKSGFKSFQARALYEKIREILKSGNDGIDFGEPDRVITCEVPDGDDYPVQFTVDLSDDVLDNFPGPWVGLDASLFILNRLQRTSEFTDKNIFEYMDVDVSDFSGGGPQEDPTPFDITPRYISW